MQTQEFLSKGIVSFDETKEGYAVYPIDLGHADIGKNEAVSSEDGLKIRWSGYGQNAVVWLYNLNQPGLAYIAYEARSEPELPSGKGIIWADRRFIEGKINVTFPGQILARNCCVERELSFVSFPVDKSKHGYMATIHDLENHSFPPLPPLELVYPAPLFPQNIIDDPTCGLVEPVYPVGMVIGITGKYILYVNKSGEYRGWAQDDGFGTDPHFATIEDPCNIIWTEPNVDENLALKIIAVNQLPSFKGLEQPVRILKRSLLSNEALKL